MSASRPFFGNPHQFSCLVPLLLLIASSSNAGPAETLRPWTEYRTIMWVGDTAYKSPERIPLFYQRLREMGINTSMVFGEAEPKIPVENQFRYYVENIVNRGLCLKFNSKVTDWDKFVTDWTKQGRPDSALIRDYCLDDAAWLTDERAAVSRVVRKNAANGPLAYNLRDELSTTLSANPFDYDFNPIALDGFRQWLQTQYASLAQLNAEWETRFSSWAEVRPFTTDQIKNRMASGDAIPRGKPDWSLVQQTRLELSQAAQQPTRWNFAPWADFRTYMDLSLAQALDRLRETSHSLDPATPVGIEGTQMPHAFGGYDLWRLSQVLDWVEPYDIAGAREIFGSFMEGRPILTTVFESETDPAARRLWHLLLEGDRGCLVWWSEDCIDWKTPDWELTKKGKALAPVMREMTSPLAQLFLRANREWDPVFIHYSQPSIQVDWLLESTVDGSTWLRRFSSFESEHNQMAKKRVAWLKSLQDLGISPRFISSAQLEGGVLTNTSKALLVLPDSWALSERECQQIARCFGENSPAGNRLLVEGPAGVFDRHGKFRGAMDSILPPAFLITNGSASVGQDRVQSNIQVASEQYLADRLKSNTGSTWLSWLKSQTTGIGLDIAVNPEARLRVHRFRIKAGRLFALERNINYQMSEELKQLGGNQSLEQPLSTEAVLGEKAHIYDLRTETYLGFTNRISFALDPWRPSLFAALREKLPAKGIVERLGH